MRYHALWLREVGLGLTGQNICTKIAAEMIDKLLSNEYIEHDDQCLV